MFENSLNCDDTSNDQYDHERNYQSSKVKFSKCMVEKNGFIFCSSQGDWQNNQISNSILWICRVYTKNTTNDEVISVLVCI